MSGFRTTDFNVHEEEDATKAPRVVKTLPPVQNSIQDFKMQDLHGRARPQDRSRGASGSPDPSRDQRFVISQLAREALSLGEEEQRLINEKVRERLSVETETARVEGFKQGHAEGLKQGHDEAYQAFQTESVQRLQQLEALIGAMEGAKRELFEANSEFLMNVVYRIAKAVLLRELTTDREYLLRLARELIERSGLRENLILKLHPQDAASVDMLRQELVKSFSGLKNLSIELSEQVGQGGCCLETEWGATDASLEVQLGEILKSLDAPAGTRA